AAPIARRCTLRLVPASTPCRCMSLDTRFRARANRKSGPRGEGGDAGASRKHEKQVPNRPVGRWDGPEAPPAGIHFPVRSENECSASYLSSSAAPTTARPSMVGSRKEAIRNG